MSIFATGSEVEIACAVGERLESDGIGADVVSLNEVEKRNGYNDNARRGLALLRLLRRSPPP